MSVGARGEELNQTNTETDNQDSQFESGSNTKAFNKQESCSAAGSIRLNPVDPLNLIYSIESAGFNSCFSKNQESENSNETLAIERL